MASSKLQALWNHPAGPKTIHFWAPTFKWGISIANVADFAKPTEKISYPQQVVIACTGIIWSRYSTVITPDWAVGVQLLVEYVVHIPEPPCYGNKNWNLFSVSVAMAGTGLYQLSRKIREDCFSDEKEVAAASLEG